MTENPTPSEDVDPLEGLKLVDVKIKLHFRAYVSMTGGRGRTPEETIAAEIEDAVIYRAPMMTFEPGDCLASVELGEYEPVVHAESVTLRPLRDATKAEVSLARDTILSQ